MIGTPRQGRLRIVLALVGYVRRTDPPHAAWTVRQVLMTVRTIETMAKPDGADVASRRVRVLSSPRLSRLWAKLLSVSPAEYVLAAASLGAGMILLLEGRITGAFGVVSGVLLAVDVLSRRGSRRLALLIVVSIAGSCVMSEEQRLQVVGLMSMAALALPLRRGRAETLFLTQTLFLTYLGTFAYLEITTTRPIAWWMVLLNLVIFNVISSVGYELAAGRRKLENELTAEIKQQRELRDALERAETLRTAIMEVREDTRTDQVLHQLVEQVRRITHAGVCQVLLPDTGQVGPTVPAGSVREDQAAAGSSLESGSLLEQVVRERRDVWVGSPLRKEALAHLRLPEGVQSVGLVPVIVKDTVFGILEVGWSEPVEASNQSRELVTALAEQASVGLERAAFQTELTQRATGAEALHRIAAKVVGRRDVETVAQEVLAALQQIYGAEAAAFYLVEGADAHPLVLSGMSRSAFEALYREYATGRRGEHLRQGRSFILINAAQERRERSRALMSAFGIWSLIDVPALGQERQVGGVVLGHRRHRVYRSDEVQLLETFAQQLAGSIELAQAQRKIEQIDHQREEFLALVAHELRHPVAAVATVAEALTGTDSLSLVEHRALKGLRQQARYLAVLAEDVLSIAQLESGQFKLRPTAFDVDGLIAGLVAQHREAARIQLQLPESPVQIEADPERLGQAFGNLLGNALKYSPAPTSVCVRVSAARDGVTIDVQDEGIGLGAEEIERLFQKYGRIDGEHRNGVKGIGLGLYLTRLLIEAHGGSVRVESPGRDQGSTFTITLPRRARAVLATANPPAGAETVV